MCWLVVQAVQDSLLAEDAERWQELDGRWRQLWVQLEEQVGESGCHVVGAVRACVRAREAPT